MALDLTSLIWRVQRPFLRHGRFAWTALIVVGLILAQAIHLASSLLRLSQFEATPALAAATPRSATVIAPSLPLPAYGERFKLTRDTIAATTGEAPLSGKISFAYQPVPEAHLVRQTAAFATQARWEELGPLLDRLQDVHRAAYISRLRLSREQADQAQLDADVQVSITYVDTGRGDAP